MKNILLLFSLLMLPSFINGQAVSWELSAEPGNQATSAATFQSANFNNCVLSRGAGVTATAGAGSMNSSAWFAGASPTTLADAIANNDYYEFTINTINCFFFNPTTIHIVLRSSATGPNTATLRCSSDGFTANIGTVTVTTTSTEFTFSETVSPNSQSVIFRLYGYGTAAGGGTPGSGGTMRIGTSVVAADNDMEVFATTTFVTVSQVTNITVNDGDAVPATVLTANVPGATVDWSRTTEDIAEPNLATAGTGNVPAFNADNNTGSPITTTFTVHATAGNCQGPNMTFTITVNPALCTITVDFFGNPSPCNDNGTPNDPTDDFFTQNIHASFFNRPATGDLQIVPGGDQIGTYSIPVVQIIGNAHTFNGVQLKADGTPSNVQMNFTDEPTCIDAAVGPTVQPCSTPPPPCTITVDFFGNPSACNDNGTPNDPTDDFFTQNIHASFFNRPTTGLLQIVPGGDQIGTYSIPVVQIIGNAHTFNGVQLKADGTPSNVQMNFTDDPTCIDAAVGPTVQPCSSGGPVCEIIGFSFANIDPCNDNGTPSNPADDFFQVDVDVLYSNSLGGATSLLLNGPDVIVQMSTQALIGTNLTHTFTNAMLRADGQITDINADIFNATPICSGPGTGPAVNSCSSGGGACDITIVTVTNVGPCDDNGTNDPTDDFFPADVAISWVNRPPTGLLQIEPGGDAITTHNVAVSGLPASGTHTFSNVHFKADGTVTVVEVEFTIPANQCTQVITGPTVQPCSPVCDITSVTLQNVGPCDDNGTVDEADDFFPADVAISFVNRPSTGNLQIEPGGDAITIHNVPVASLPVNGSHTFTNVHFKADGTVTVVEVEFTIPANLCTQIITGPTVDPCSFLPPVLTCPAPITVSCADLVPTPNPASVSVSNDCPGNVTVIHVGDVTSNVTCINRLTITRTYQATDACGQSATCSQIITVNDQTPPTVTCPPAITVSCASNVPPVDVSMLGVTDNCAGTVGISRSFVGEVITNQTCTNRYTITRTYKGGDACGNTATCTQVITVFDNTPPSITCPVSVTVQCASQVPSPNIAGVVTSDNCGGATTVVHVSDVTVNQTCINRYTLNRTYRSTDICGNSATCVQVIIVFDNTVPTLTCPAPVTVQCANLVPAVNTASVITADNCGGVVTVTLAADVTVNQTCINRYTLNRIYRSTDACGNSATCTQVITVFDNTPPVITFADPLIMGVPNGGRVDVQCFGQDPNWDLPDLNESSVTVTDNCTGTVTVAFTQVLDDEGNCPVDGYINLYRLTWTATDACGNSSSKYLFLALVDHIPPVIEGVPDDITVNCDEIPDPPSDVHAIDECIDATIISFNETSPAPGCQNGQVITRSWKARDDCGNETIEVQHITLIDHKGPQLQLLQPELAGLPDGTVLYYTCNEGGIPEFFDELNAESVYSEPSCGTSGNISFESDFDVANNCKRFGYLEQKTVHWRGVDQCGNETHLTIYARLIDTEVPYLIGVPDIVCINDPALNDVDAYDNCDHPSIRYWDVNIPNPCGSGMAIRRTYEVNDECGNMARDTAILIPNNQNPPVIVFINPVLANLKPGEILEINCSVHDGRYTSFGPEDVSVVSGCRTDVIVSFTEKVIERHDCADGIVAELSLEWTATDLCGNSSIRTIEASVVDREAPVFTNLIPELTIGCTDYFPEPSATDNCGDVVIQSEETIIPGPCIYEYDVVRQLTATDPCGNTTTAMQTIHFGNSSGPVIEGVVPEICDDLSIPTVTAYDPCANTNVDVVMTEKELDSSCREGKVIERTWTATDHCGHVTEVHQIIVVNDQTPPEILVPTYSVILRFLDQPYNHILLSQTDLIKQLNDLSAYSVFIEDECDKSIEPVFTLEISHAADCQGDGYWERRVYTWMATDICGNTSSLSFSVDILDDIPPVFIGAPDDVTLICQPLPPVPIVQTEDPAQPVNIIYAESINDGQAPGEYDVTRQWEATDACGNLASISQHIYWIPDTHLACNILVPGIVECNSHNVTISSAVSGGLGELSYEWEIFGDQCFIQSGQGTNTLFIYVGWSEVEIVLRVVDAYGCSTTCTTNLDCFDTSIDFNAGNQNNFDSKEGIHLNKINPSTITHGSSSGDWNEIRLWPNPAHESISINFEAMNDEKIEFSLINLLGEVVYKSNYTSHKGLNTHSLDISTMMEGGYLLQMKSKKDIVTKRMVILHQE